MQKIFFWGRVYNIFFIVERECCLTLMGELCDHFHPIFLYPNLQLSCAVPVIIRVTSCLSFSEHLQSSILCKKRKSMQLYFQSVICFIHPGHFTWTQCAAHLSRVTMNRKVTHTAKLSEIYSGLDMVLIYFSEIPPSKQNEIFTDWADD